MKITFLYGIAAILVLSMSAACSQAPVTILAPVTPLAKKERPMMSPSVAAGYVVTAPGEGEAAIRRVFAPYGVETVRALGNGQYELRLNRDPGIDVLNAAVAGSDGNIKAIQPNYVYRIN